MRFASSRSFDVDSCDGSAPQVQRQRRWTQRRQLRDAAIINRQRAKTKPPGGAWDSSLVPPSVANALLPEGLGSTSTGANTSVAGTSSSTAGRQRAASAAGARDAGGFGLADRSTTNRRPTETSRPGANASTRTRTTSSSPSRPMSHREWKKSQKRNKFLQSRKVHDRFAKSEAPEVAAARRRREAVTAEMHHKDHGFQAVLDACWGLANTCLLYTSPSPRDRG